MAQKSITEAHEQLFDSILDALAEIDAFSGPSSPSLFIVYAHDPDIEDREEESLGPAYAETVKTLIAWLRKLRTPTLSDRHPLTQFTFEARSNGSNAVRDILENQICLLPNIHGGGPGKSAIRTVDKVSVCGSPRLKSYRTHPLAAKYIDAVHRTCRDYLNRAGEKLRERLLRDVLRPYLGVDEFHHVLTELGFLELRQRYDPDNHGIVLLALDSSTGMDYLEFPEPTNLRLKLDATQSPMNRHRQFFKLLRHIYTDCHLAVEAFENCFAKASLELSSKKSSRSDPEVKALIERALSHARQDLIRDQNAELRQGRVRMQQAASEAVALEKRRNMFLKDLPSVPYRDRKDRNPVATQGTCKWFTDHPTFLKWHREEALRLLWVSAYPGCGKSVLLRHLVDKVLANPSTIVAYFFFKDDFNDQRSSLEALRCLIHQICIQKPTVLSNSILQKFDRDQSLKSSLSGLSDVLIEISKTTTKRVICVLDALDECQQPDRENLIRSLVQLEKYSSQRNLMFLVSSRLYPDIQQEFHDLASEIHLGGEGDSETAQISQEIDMFIRCKLKDLGPRLHLSEKQQALIEGKLTKSPQRTYLWAHLVIKEIEHTLETDTRSLNRIIDQLPSSVDEAYEKILSRSSDRSRVERMLHIVISAIVPLSLKEFAEAWAVRENARCFKDLEIGTEEQTLRLVQGLCGLFVVVHETKLYLIHQTAREFLLLQLGAACKVEQPLLGWKGSIDKSDAHLTMSRICLYYLKLSKTQKKKTLPPVKRAALFRARIGLEPGNWSLIEDSPVLSHDPRSFLGYARKFWNIHFRRTPESISEEVVRLAAESCDPNLFHLDGRLLDKIHNATNFFMTHGPAPTTLEVAVALRLWRVVDLLLDQQDSSIESRNTPKKATPLITASEIGDSKIVLSLLSHGADISATDVLGRSALHYAAMCQSAQIEIINALLVNGGDLAAIDQDWYTPLRHAIMSGPYEVVKALLELGADANEASINDRTLLFTAIHERNIPTAILLLKHGADPNRIDKYGDMALDAALDIDTVESFTIVREMVKYGVEIDAVDGRGETALHRAARDFNFHGLSVLLENGAEPNVVGHEGRTPLHIGVKYCDVDFVQVLLRGGADVGVVDKTGRTVVDEALNRPPSEESYNIFLALWEHGGRPSWHHGTELAFVRLAMFYRPQNLGRNLYSLLICSTEPRGRLAYTSKKRHRRSLAKAHGLKKVWTLVTSKPGELTILKFNSPEIEPSSTEDDNESSVFDYVEYSFDCSSFPSFTDGYSQHGSDSYSYPNTRNGRLVVSRWLKA